MRTIVSAGAKTDEFDTVSRKETKKQARMRCRINDDPCNVHAEAIRDEYTFNNSLHMLTRLCFIHSLHYGTTLPKLPHSLVVHLSLCPSSFIPPIIQDVNSPTRRERRQHSLHFQGQKHPSCTEAVAGWLASRGRGGERELQKPAKQPQRCCSASSATQQQRAVGLPLLGHTRSSMQQVLCCLALFLLHAVKQCHLS